MQLHEIDTALKDLATLNSRCFALMHRSPMKSGGEVQAIFESLLKVFVSQAAVIGYLSEHLDEEKKVLASELARQFSQSENDHPLDGDNE